MLFRVTKNIKRRESIETHVTVYTSFCIYAYFCNLTYTVQIFVTFHVIAAKMTWTSSPASKGTRAAQIIG